MRSVLLGALLLLPLAGCAFTTDTVDIRYQSTAAAAPIPGAAQIAVTVVVNDARSGRPDQVSVKKNGYGMEMAPILASRPVADIIRDAVTDELRRDGFGIGPGGKAVVVDIAKFNNDFKTGFFSGDAASEVFLSVQVRTASGQIAYSRPITGENATSGVVMMGGDNAKQSLERSLSNAVAKLMADPSFTQALQARASGGTS